MRITVYHSFHDEVQHYKRHVWRCTVGVPRRPKADTNSSRVHVGLSRPISASSEGLRTGHRDPRHIGVSYAETPFQRCVLGAKHQAECGGTYVKESSPDPPVETETGPKQETLDNLLSKLKTNTGVGSNERERKRRRVDHGPEIMPMSPQSTSSSSAGRRVHIGMAEKLEERRRRKAAQRTAMDYLATSANNGMIDLRMYDPPSSSKAASVETAAISLSSDEDETQRRADKRLTDRLAAEPLEVQKIPVRDTPQARAALMRFYGIAALKKM